MIRLVSFLGNPGEEYASSRHNLPWLLSERITADHRLTWQQRFKGTHAQVKIGDSITYLHKPFTYMNLCGRSVLEIMTYFKIPAENMLVIHDDVEMEQGEIGLKFGGGLGGHKGLRSIREVLGTLDFYRLRIGIGRPQKGSVSSYVLKKISSSEIEDFHPVLDAAAGLIEKLIDSGGGARELVERYSRYRVT